MKSALLASYCCYILSMNVSIYIETITLALGKTKVV